MTTYLITWNPKRWPWTELKHDVAHLRKRGFVDIRWSCGRTRRIERGDRIFLLRQGLTPRGIVAAGHATRPPFEAPHFDAMRPNDAATYIQVRLDTLLDAEVEPILERTELETGHLAKVHWSTQSSGIRIGSEASAQLETVWSDFLEQHAQSPVVLPDEIVVPEQFFEGATRQISVSIYERSTYARQRCIEHYGCRCAVCDFDFEKVYGELGSGFIHVHHLKPLSEIREEYEIDPISDLRPICPNCHAMIHRGAEMLSIEDLRGTLEKHSPPN